VVLRAAGWLAVEDEGFALTSYDFFCYLFTHACARLAYNASDTALDSRLLGFCPLEGRGMALTFPRYRYILLHRQRLAPHANDLRSSDFCNMIASSFVMPSSRVVHTVLWL